MAEDDEVVPVYHANIVEMRFGPSAIAPSRAKDREWVLAEDSCPT